MKKIVGLLILGAVLGVLIALNILRIWQERSPGLDSFGGGNVLPKASSSISIDPRTNPTRAAAAILEKAVVNIDIVGRPVSVPGFDFFGMGSRFVYPEGSGSGVIIRKDGFIVTNNHVIESAQTITVTLSDGSKVHGEVWARDPNFDLAVVKIPRSGLPFATLGDSGSVRVGDPVIAVGNALGLGTTVTSGIISARERAVSGPEGGRGLAKAIQTDAAINRGNSGGALALMNGEVIGINTAILSSNPGGGNIGIGFAIPSNTVREVVTELIKHRSFQAPAAAFVGLVYGPNNPDDAQMLKERYGFEYPSVTDGIIVGQVLDGGPASKAGVKVFDNILSIDGKALKAADDFRNIIRQHKPGDVIKITLYRPALAKKITLSVTLTAAPQSQEPAPSQPKRGFRFPF